MATILRIDDDDGPIEVTVTGLTRDAYTALVDDHPPAPADPGPWSEETFPPALIAACCALTPQAAAAVWDEWPADVAEEILATCMRLSAPGSIEWAQRRLRTDHRLAIEVDYATGHGIPHSVFAAWSDRDQDLAIASHVAGLDAKAAARNTCPGCGVPAAAMGDYDAAHVVDLPCVHCKTRADWAAALPEGSTHVHLLVVDGPDREPEGES